MKTRQKAGQLLFIETFNSYEWGNTVGVDLKSKKTEKVKNTRVRVDTVGVIFTYG